MTLVLQQPPARPLADPATAPPEATPLLAKGRLQRREPVAHYRQWIICPHYVQATDLLAVTQRTPYGWEYSRCPRCLFKKSAAGRGYGRPAGRGSCKSSPRCLLKKVPPVVQVVFGRRLGDDQSWHGYCRYRYELIIFGELWKPFIHRGFKRSVHKKCTKIFPPQKQPCSTCKYSNYLPLHQGNGLLLLLTLSQKLLFIYLPPTIP